MRMKTTLPASIEGQNNDRLLMENEYIGDDGLIHCSICHEAKEKRIPDDSIARRLKTIPLQCACERKMRKAEKEQRIAEEHQRIVLRLRSICFQAPFMYTWTFENSKYDSEQLTVAKSYVKNWEKNKKRNSGLLFWGDVGTGKSYLAACIANALIDQEVSVRMITLADVLNHKLEDRAEFIQELCSPSLLILDDFGMERDTSFGIEIVSFVVNTRVQMNKPLILTTNLSYDEIKNAPDTDHERIYSRIRGVTVPVKFSGPDHRDNLRREHLQQMKNHLQEEAFLNERNDKSPDSPKDDTDHS